METDYQLIVSRDFSTLKIRYEGYLYRLACAFTENQSMQARELTEKIKIASINCTLKLADIYDRIKFPPPKPTLVPLSVEEVQTQPAKSSKKKAKSAKSKAKHSKKS